MQIFVSAQATEDVGKYWLRQCPNGTKRTVGQYTTACVSVNFVISSNSSIVLLASARKWVDFFNFLLDVLQSTNQIDLTVKDIGADENCLRRLNEFKVIKFVNLAYERIDCVEVV